MASSHFFSCPYTLPKSSMAVKSSGFTSKWYCKTLLALLNCLFLISCSTSWFCKDWLNTAMGKNKNKKKIRMFKYRKKSTKYCGTIFDFQFNHKLTILTRVKTSAYHLSLFGF